MKITSLQNSQVKQIVKLRVRAHRDACKTLVIEGLRPLRRAFAAGWRIDELYFCPALFADEREWMLLKEFNVAGVKGIECSESVLRKISYRRHPEGVLALAEQAGIPFAELKVGPNPLLLVAEGVEKPGNLGAMLRVADGAGVEAVILCDGVTDINNPNVVRSSVGALFSVPVVEASSLETFEWLKEHGIRSLAATPGVESEYTRLNLTGGLAVVVGAEKPGLSDFWLRSADIRARIPMLGRGDSLNVSISAAVLLYEAVRQRADDLLVT